MTTERAPAPHIILIALLVAAPVMGLTLVAPALPSVKEAFDASNPAVQQLLSVYLITLAAGQLFYGTLSDRVGRRPVLLFGASMFALFGLLAATAKSIESLTLYRGLQGLGAAASMSMGRAMINDCFERQQAAKMMSVASGILAIAPILSLAFGGWLTEVAGWQGTMLVISASGAGVLAASLFLVKETNLNPTSSINLSSVLNAYATVTKNRIFTGFVWTSGMQVGMFFAMNGFMPFQYQRHGYSATEFGMWFSLTAVCYLVGNTINTLYFVSRGLERAALIGCFGTLLATTSMFATQAMGMTHALSLALPCCLFGLSNGIVAANVTVGAISAAGKHAGTGTGLAGAWQMAAGAIAGAIIVGLGGAENFLLAATCMILMSLASTLSIYFVYKKTQHPGNLA